MISLCSLNISASTILPVSFFSFFLFPLQPQNEQATASKHHMQPLSHQPQFHPIHQNHHQNIHQTQPSAHFSQSHQCGAPSHLSEIIHGHQSPTIIPQHMACLPPITGGHVSGRLHALVMFLLIEVLFFHFDNSKTCSVFW